MSQSDIPAVIFGFTAIWLWGFSIGLEYGIRYAKYTRKGNNAPHSN